MEVLCFPGDLFAALLSDLVEVEDVGDGEGEGFELVGLELLEDGFCFLFEVLLGGLVGVGVDGDEAVEVEGEFVVVEFEGEERF